MPCLETNLSILVRETQKTFFLQGCHSYQISQVFLVCTLPVYFLHLVKEIITRIASSVALFITLVFALVFSLRLLIRKFLRASFPFAHFDILFFLKFIGTVR